MAILRITSPAKSLMYSKKTVRQRMEPWVTQASEAVCYLACQTLSIERSAVAREDLKAYWESEKTFVTRNQTYRALSVRYKWDVWCESQAWFIQRIKFALFCFRENNLDSGFRSSVMDEMFEYRFWKSIRSLLNIFNKQ